VNQKQKPHDHTIEIFFRANNYNGYPRIKTFLDGVELPKCNIDSESFVISVGVNDIEQKRVLTIERYGKTQQHTAVDGDGNIIDDQYIELLDIKVDDISTPEFLIYTNTKFEFNDQCESGCRVLGPNGVWTFEFETPIIRYVLDQKIMHEAQFNNDYVYAWSFKLGPNSVAELTDEINTVIKNVENIL
jgi:hypothetical protein